MSVYTNQYLRLEWWNDCDLSDIVYQTGFRQRMYLATDVGKPKYPVEEEGSTDGNGVFIPTFQKWNKQYSFRILVNEYQMDALTMIPLHDNVYVYLQNGESIKVVDITIGDPEWTEEGNTAMCDITFITDSITKACCANIDFISDEEMGTITIDYSFRSEYELNMLLTAKEVCSMVINWGDNNIETLSLPATTEYYISHLFDAGAAGKIKIYKNLHRLEKILFGADSNSAITNVTFSNICTALNSVWVYNAPGSILSINSTSTLLEYLQQNSCAATDFQNIDSFINLRTLSLNNNALSSAKVNALLISIDTYNIVTTGIRTINLSGGSNEAPTGTGITAKTSLQAKGWTVSTN